MREALDEFVGARNLSHPNDLLQGGRWLCDGDVFPNCSAEHKIFLEDNPDPIPEMREIEGLLCFYNERVELHVGDELS